MNEYEPIIKKAIKNPTEFKAIVERLQRPLFKYLSGFNLSHARIEELVQETFLRTYKSLKSYHEDKGASFSTWVFTIAKRLAINELKRYENRLQKVSEESLEYHTSENTNLQDQQEHNLIEQEKKVSLKKALDKLPEHYRSPLLLSYINGLTMDQIANIENCSAGTIKSRIYRAKIHLKSFIDTLDEENI